MAEVQWSPAELDRLEDALEDLEQPGALQRGLEDEPSPQVRERLEDYRSLLAASREAMPLQEVPAGLLDDVLAEAGRAAATPMAAAAASEGSWWTRARRSFLVPAVALAGTAVLVLWIGRPDEQAALTDPPAPPPESPAPAAAGDAVQREAPADGEEPASELEHLVPQQAAGQAAPARPEYRQGNAEGELGATLETKLDANKDAADPADDAPPVVGGEMGSLGDAPGATDEQKQKSGGAAAGPATGRWDIISLGDRARQAGDCVAARDQYSMGLEDDEPAVRARAFAGLGLCDAQAGDDPSADASYDRARELDGGIDQFIDSQSERKSPPRTKRKKSSKPKAKKKASKMDPAVDPFG